MRRGVNTDLKRFNISLTNEMETHLNEEKKETYYSKPQSEMIRDLIARGLAAIREEKQQRANCKNSF